MKIYFLLVIMIIGCFNISQAQPGELNHLFGTKGTIIADLGAGLKYNSEGRQTLLQTDGSMYIIFETSKQTLVTRRLPNGATDLSYGRGGFTISFPITNAHSAIQPDGKLLVVGSIPKFQRYIEDDVLDLMIVRYNVDGTVDNSFGKDGTTVTDFRYGSNEYVRSISLQQDGKILVMAQSFNNGGEFAIAAIARYNVNGNLDNSFNDDGILLNDILDNGIEGAANAVAILPDGKIIMAGYFRSYDEDRPGFALVRLKADGYPDETFNKDGLQTISFGTENSSYANAVAIQSDGKIVVAGYTTDIFNNSDFAVARLDAEGNPDKTFSGDGRQTSDFTLYDDAYLITIQEDGKIVVGGGTFVARYTSKGLPDIGFGSEGHIKTAFSINDMAMQNDGKMVLTGTTSNEAVLDFAVARYTIEGNLDNTFYKEGRLTDRFQQGSTGYYSTAVQKDGKIVAAGFTSNGSNYDFVLVRYNTNGSLDNTFDGDGIQSTDFGGADDSARSIAIQNDGKIILAGSAAGDFAIARYNSNGTLDKTFSKDGKQTFDISLADNANSIAIQKDGKIVIGGTSVVRFTKNGQPDFNFGNNGSIQLHCNDLAIQDDGKIVVIIDSFFAGFYVARYNIDGSPDITFDEDGQQITDFEQNADSYPYAGSRSVAIQNDGKIVVAGYLVTNSYRDYVSEFALIRYNADGSLDESFSEDGKQTTYIDLGSVYQGSAYANANSLFIQSNGKIIVAGSSGYNFSLPNQYSHFTLARYDLDGELDKGFSDDGKVRTTSSSQKAFISDITIANNKLYAAGYGEFPGSLAIVTSYLLEEVEITKVTITNPVNDAIYTGPASVELTAIATAASGGSIKKVQFFSGTTLLATQNFYPYTYTWHKVPAGEYFFTAKAFDNDGNVTVSSVVHVTVLANKPPIVSLKSPVNNATYFAPAHIPLIAEAKDEDGTIRKVQFFNGNTLLATQNFYPYNYTWHKIPEGEYLFTAQATDDKGLVTTSEMVRVSVTEPNAIVNSSKINLDKTSDANLFSAGALSLKLSPVPTKDVLNIYISGVEKNEKLTISVVSLSGMIIKNIQSVLSPTMQINVASLQPGNYYLKVKYGDKMLYTSFVKL